MRPTLVVGAGGLLGRAVRRAIGAGVVAADVRWATVDQDGDLTAAVDALSRRARDGGGHWTIVWSAGRSVIATEADEAAAETAALATVVAAARRSLPDGPGGRIVLASSAGAIHAGSTAPPFDETTPPAPRSPYGAEKLEQERLLAAAARTTGCDAVAVRMGPLYGLGQDVTKAQGLVTALCRSVIDRRPVRIYVPLDTRRPYLWSDDAGRIVAQLAASGTSDGGTLRVRTVPGGPAISLGRLVETVRRITRRRPPVLVAPGPEAAGHAVDLRLASQHPDDTTLVDPTPMTVGLGRLWRGLLAEPVRRAD